MTENKMQEKKKGTFHPHLNPPPSRGRIFRKG